MQHSSPTHQLNTKSDIHAKMEWEHGKDPELRQIAEKIIQIQQSL